MSVREKDLDSPLNQYVLVTHLHPDLRKPARTTYAVLRANYYADLRKNGTAEVNTESIKRAAEMLDVQERVVWYDLDSIREYLQEKRLQ